MAYNAGLVSAREATALGVNVNFDPCVDILFNWRNTIVNTRAYGTDADTVIRHTSAYIEGLNAEREIVTCIKHFPGDGTEERDQHLVLGVNELTPEQWDDSFGRVYRAHIDSGVEMIMAGHIALPEYQKKLDPTLADADILPATLAPELLQGLLKTQLGFNGVVITDASHMLGMSSAMRREDYVPGAIAAGCDMFLFFNDIDEDFGFMLKGLREGVITAERMDDAVRRVLGLKAKLNLHVKAADGTLQKAPEELDGRRVRGAPADARRRRRQGHHPGQEHPRPAAPGPREAPAHPAVLPVRRGRRDLRGRLGHAGRLRRRAGGPRVRGHGQRRQHPGQGPDAEVPRRGRCRADRRRRRGVRRREQLPDPLEDSR